MSISSDPDVGNSYVSQCNHEEADTRVFLHTKDIYMKGYETIVIRTVDPDVLGLSVSAFTHLAIKLMNYGLILVQRRIRNSLKFTKSM